MTDRRFYVRSSSGRLSDLLLDAPETIDVQADLGQHFSDVSALEMACPDDISFVGGDAKYKEMAERSLAGLFIVSAKSANWLAPGASFIICPNPIRLFNHIVGKLYPDLAAGFVGRFDQTHNISPSAKVDTTAEIAPSAIIGDHVEVGAGTKIGPLVTIGHGTQIGRDCLIYSHVSIAYALIGNRVQISNGARIGVDGFGLIEGKKHEKVLHLGRVILQDDVEIGANCTMDRGTYGDTVIGEGSKIDNLVHIAHNTQVGRHVRIAGMSGIAGSAIIDDYATLGGGVGLGNGAHIGAHAIVGGRSVVLGKVPEHEIYSGYPARPLKEWQRQKAFIAQLFKKSLKDKNRG